ncbi:MAG: hypothetical protein QNJ78_12535 [Gammaproteobacteria bacterium]|nr:hypothetical protein [Gammaproteobacteria bacterium]
MNMFDSKDKHRRDRRRPPPPPYYAPPRPAFPGAVYQPGVPVPYGPYPQQPRQTLQSTAPQPAAPPPVQAPSTAPAIQSASQPAANQAMTATQTPRQYAEQPAGEYQFRPMPSMRPSPETETRSPYVSEPSASAPAPERQPTAQPSPKVQEYSQEPAMINGKPAVFRPLHLGTEQTE